MRALYHILIAVLAALPLSALTGAQAQAPEVQDIVNRASAAAYYQGRDGKAKIHMAITDSQSRERTRDFVILRRDTDDVDNGEQAFYVLFTRPADVNKTAFMVWKHTDRDDDRWLYLPALDLVKRIAASDERTSFVGSHFFYEDVSGRGPAEDNHELVEDSETYYTVKSTPKDPDAVEFDHYVSWIHKATFIPIKSEYYDGTGKVFRTYNALKVDTVSGYPTVTQSSMEDHRLGGKTVMSYSAVQYDIGLPEDIFTERYLRAPPRKQLR
ncbi:MAG: outer membrane lipoprotein-sorting protein [Rhodospirillales bacterium]|nr:outer membrane lipoprotein-sorting protein [Rhodospirillales bacterium]